MKNEKHYGCPGCGAEISENEYKKGQTTCNDKDCERYGEPFEQLQYCQACDEHYNADSADKHSECG
jgi:hypothetical protein